MTKTALYSVRFLLLLIFFFLVREDANARITLSLNGKELSMQQLRVGWIFDTSQNRSFERWQQIKKDLVYLDTGSLKMSYKSGMYWLQLDLSQLPTPDSLVYLEVRNPHINYLGTWLISGGALVKQYQLTGDHLPFNSREIHHSQIIYKIDLKNRKDLQLVLMVDKRNEQLHLPLNFYNDKGFLSHQRNNNLLAGLFVGILIFILLFTFFLYFNIRERLYIYYALYVLMITGYIFSDLGFSFMYLYPNVPVLNDLSRPVTFLLAPILYIFFTRSLLNVKQNFPQVYRYTNIFLLFFSFCFIVGLSIARTGYVPGLWMFLMNILMALSLIPAFVLSILGLFKGIRYSSYILVASTFYTVFTQIYKQYLTGDLPESFINRHAVNIGFSVELILLTMALSIRFKNYKLDAEDLWLQLNRQQENIFRNISEYQEREMKRLSGLLHDSIGAGLSSIKYNLEAVDSEPGKRLSILKSTIEDVTNLTDEIRNISHTMSPLLLQQKGLLKGLEDLTERYNRTGRLKIWIESIGSLHRASFQNELLVFRIVQELLQNVIKHAEATEVMIQLIIEPEIISVLVEDNGKGCDTDEIKEGLGFSQIKALATFVKGQFEVRSKLNKGCSVSIEFPTIPYDHADKSIASR